MFGYVRYDFPNLFVKDVMLYKALYCGLCKSIGKACGQSARIGLSYDMTFFSALLHNIKGVDVVIERQNCFEHAIRKRPIAKTDELTEALGALNTALVYQKLTDDAEDGEGGRGKRLFFKRGFARAKKNYPELVAAVETLMREQKGVEADMVPSLDMAAEPTARMTERVSDLLLGESATAHTRGLCYDVGKWIYLIDALDDYDKDKKRGAYNPFEKAYGAPSKKELMRSNAQEISFVFDTLFYSMREHLGGIAFRFNRDLTDNVILRGIPLETMRVMKGEKPEPMSVKI